MATKLDTIFFDVSLAEFFILYSFEVAMPFSYNEVKKKYEEVRESDVKDDLTTLGIKVEFMHFGFGLMGLLSKGLIEYRKSTFGTYYYLTRWGMACVLR